MRYIPDPGNWGQFKNKPENQKLSLQEVTQKFKHEQLFFNLQNQQAAHAAAMGKSTRRRFQSQAELRTAIELWVNNRNAALGHYGPINTWDVSGVTSMVGLFLGFTTFNDAIDSWDVSNVTNMTAMFYGAQAFNGDLSTWNVEKVTSMTEMFNDATAMRVDSLSAWNPFSLTVATGFMNLADTVQNTADYDLLLIAWGAHAAAGEIPANIGNVDFGDVKFTKATSAAATGRGQLVTRGFVPVDGGATT